MMYTDSFKLAVRHLTSNFVLPQFHMAMVAQWILESDRGNSKLAREQNNFAGMKWRKELIGIGEPKIIQVPSEPHPVEFASFKSPQDFVRGFYAFLDRAPYEGWRNQQTSDEYIRHIGKVWATDPSYIQKVVSLFPEARKIIETMTIEVELSPSWFELFKDPIQSGAVVVGYNGGRPLWYTQAKTLEHYEQLKTLFGIHNVEVAPEGKRVPTANFKSISDLQKLYQDDDVRKEPGSKEPAKKPVVRWVRSPNFSARSSGPINQIVLHYTTSSNINGTISWFQNPASRVSAHYIVGRDGTIVQMVRDSDKAWHAAGFNDRTIGIENVAAPGQQLAGPQSESLASLCKWLMAEYRIPKSQVTGHKFLPNSTDCPGDLFGARTEEALKKWINEKLS